MNSRKENKRVGDRLRHLSKLTDTISLNEALEIIIMHGSKPEIINATGFNNWSPLFWSVRRKNTDLSHALMQTSGLNINLIDMYGYTVLSHAMDAYDIDHELIRHLLSRDDLDVSQKTYRSKDSTHLFSFTTTVRTAPLIRGANALYFATLKKELFQYIPRILDLINGGENDYVTKVTSSTRIGQNDRITVRQHCGADGFIYMHFSPLTNLLDNLSQCNEAERAFILPVIARIANSPSPNSFKRIKIQPKDEALLIAARTGDKEVVEILLAAGADTNYTDHENRNAAALAKFSQHHEIEELIEFHNLKQKNSGLNHLNNMRK